MKLLKYIFFLLPFATLAQSGTTHTGKVNINNGTTVPTERLYVNGSARITGALQLNNYTSGVLTVNGSGIVGVTAGGSVPTAGANGTVLTSNGTTYSWNLLTNTNIATGAGIFVSKLASGADNTVIKTLAGGGGIGWGLISNDNIDGSAGITLNKIATGTNNTFFGTQSSLNGSFQVTDAFIASGANIAISKIALTNNRVPYGASSLMSVSSRLQFDGISFSVGGAAGLNNSGGENNHVIELVNDNTLYNGFRTSTYGPTASLQAQNNFHWIRADGTAATPTNTKSGMTFMSHGMRGFDGTSMSASSASFTSQATENWTTGGHGTKFSWQTTPNGSITRSGLMEFGGDGKLTTNGGIGITGNIDLSNDAYNYQIAGLNFGGKTGDYHYLSGPANNVAVAVGGNTALTNQYTNNTHIFKNSATIEVARIENTGSGKFTIGGINIWRNGTSNNGNIGVGGNALNGTLTGLRNLAIGDSALRTNTAGFDNVAIGGHTLEANTVGIQNTAVGSGALVGSTGDGNTAVGAAALNQALTGSGNIGIGAEGGRLLPVGGSNNIAIGHTGNGLSGSNNIIIGANAQIMYSGSNFRIPAYTTNGVVTTTGGNGTFTVASTIPASTISGTDTQVAYWNGGVLTGDNNFWRSGTSMGLGIPATTGYNFISRVAFNTANANSVGIGSEGRLETGATNVRYFATDITAQGAASPTGVYHFSARQGSISSAIIANQYGFHVDNNLSGATNNYGFHGNVGVNGTSNWNLYMSGTAPNYLAGSLGVGSTALTGYNLRAAANITGGTSNTSHGIESSGQIQSDVTTLSSYYRTNASTAASSFTLTTMNHFSATQGTIGAGSAVTNQMGFMAGSSLTGATNNYGFYGNIASGTGRYNLYMNGTADNHINGRIGIGSTSLTDRLIHLVLPISGATTAYGIMNNASVQSGVTGTANYNFAQINTQATSFTLNSAIAYAATQGTIGAGSSIGTQTGFNVSGMTGATNNYGFRGQMNSGSGIYNIYMDGTAQNFLAGNVGIGSGKSVPGEALDVNGNVKASQFKLAALNTAPSSASDTGTTGEIRVDATYIYICTATNTWKRAAIATW